MAYPYPFCNVYGRHHHRARQHLLAAAGRAGAVVVISELRRSWWSSFADKTTTTTTTSSVGFRRVAAVISFFDRFRSVITLRHPVYHHRRRLQDLRSRDRSAIHDHVAAHNRVDERCPRSRFYE